MAKKPREFYLYDAAGVFIGPVEADTCPENATEERPKNVGAQDSTPVLIGGSWKDVLNVDIEKAREVRIKRDSLLAESDYTQCFDSPVDQNVWSEYRQLLRDIPVQKDFPAAVEWPAKPKYKKVDAPKK